MRLSLLLFALFSPLLVLAQSSTSTSTSPSSASANATATPSNNSTDNTTLQTITTTITSLIPVPSGSTSATSTSLLTLTLTLNASSPVPSSNNATVNGTAPLGNDTADANATEPAQWKEGDDWIPFHISIDPAYGVLGALLILSGIPVAGLGGKNRWSSLAVVSGYALMLFTLVMILRFGVQDNLQPPSPSPPSTMLRGLYLLACIVAGFIGAGIGIFFFNISKHFVSAAGGFAFGWFLLATKSGGLITSILGRWGLLGGLTVGALVVSIVPRTALLMVLVSTAWIGATAVMLGVDCYTRAGLKEFYIYNLGFHSLFPKLGGAKYPLTQTMIIELGLLAAIVLIGGAIQARVLNRIQKRLREARQEEEMRLEAEEVSRAAERFKNAGSELREWEEKHGNGKGVVDLDPSQTLHDGVSAHLPILAREPVTTHRRPSSPHLPPIDTGSRALHEELQIDSAGVKRGTATPSTITFHETEELKDESATARTRTGHTSPVAVDPELEEKIRLLEEVRKARESIRGSIDELHRQTPTSTMGGKFDASRPVTPSYSLGAMSDGMSRMSAGSHKVDELDLRTRRASAASSRVLLDGLDSARIRPRSTTNRLINAAHSRDPSGGSGEVVSSPTSPADWDRYVSDGKIIAPTGPMEGGARYPPHDAFDRRGMAASMINLSGPSSSRTSSDDRRTRATSMSMPVEESGLGQYSSTPLAAPSRDSHSRTDSYGPGQVTGSASHRHSATLNPRTQSRSMTYDELADRHQKHIKALQNTVRDEAKEEEKVRAARERWERQKREEKAEMERKERHAMAAKSNKKDKGEQKQEVLKSTDEWRRSVHMGLDQLGRPVNPPAHPRDRSYSRGDPTRPRDKRTSSMIN